MLILFVLIFFFSISNVSATNETFSVDDVVNASSSVQSYVETNHKLPDSVYISGHSVSMEQFLKLQATAISNIKNNVTTDISLASYNNASNPSETITQSGNLSNSSYISLANNVSAYMDTNGRAPDYRTTTLGNMRYESLIYTFSQILNSYRVAKVLPSIVRVNPWTTISNNSTVFISMNQISDMAETIQTYIETNHKLPNNVTISGNKITMPQFLKLVTMYLKNANCNLYAPIILKNYGTAPNPSESITGGNLNQTSYMALADEIISFMDTNGRAPNFKATIRGNIRYESMVYFFSQIVNSANRNLCLPTYLTLTPWANVTNTNTVFVSMDQINSAVWTVQSYVEINHALPPSINIAGRQITMPQFLFLEIQSLKNINAGLYTSIVLRTFSNPSSPSETLTVGTLSKAAYLNYADNVESYMKTNGKPPAYTSTQQGNMRYESIVYLYAQILNYYNTKNSLPDYITVNRWSVVTSASTVKLSQDQVISAAKLVKDYVETNHTLPSSISISGSTINMYQFLKLEVTSLRNINSELCGSILLASYNPPTSISETVVSGNINSSEYLSRAKELETFMYGNNRAPNYQNTSLGNMRYESLIYMYAQILSSYGSNNKLPDFIVVNPWSVVSNSSTKFFTTDQIKTAAGNVQNYVETNHTLPTTVNISGTSVTMPQFLKLVTTALLNINGTLNASIVLKNYNTATSPSETFSNGTLNSTVYLKLVKDCISYMNTNGKAPTNQNTTMGTIRYESLVYLYSQILNKYENEVLPQNITVTPWSIVSNSSNVFLSADQIKEAAISVQSYIETNHQLPDTVNISGINVSMSQYLQLSTTALLTITGDKYTSIILRNFNAPTSPSENISSVGNLSSTEYSQIANAIINYMYANGKAPNSMSSSMGNISFNSLVYIYSQILSSQNATNCTPQLIIVNPWSVVSNNSTVFITTEQMKTAAGDVKSYIEINHQLPDNVTISGNQITMPQFLNLLVKSTINIENYMKTSVILENVNTPSNSTENMTSGTVLSSDFLDMAFTIKNYMDSNGMAPNNVSDICLGDRMGYESLIYMYSKILNSYNATGPATYDVKVIPWIAITNPNGTFNFRTQEVFNSIQEAIDDVDTMNGDTIWLQNTNYLENVIINKNVIIKPVSGINVTVQALDANLPVFTINTAGNSTTIRDLIISGSLNSSAIFINNSTGNQILGNTINNSINGIYLNNSSDNVIAGNTISNNSLNGVQVVTSDGNEVSSNKLMNNGLYGISLENSNENKICANIISNNIDGIHVYNSSGNITYNHIIQNSRYGLYVDGNGTINASNNWWGSNNPIVSTTEPSDICIVGGNVTYNPWLVLNITSSCDRNDRNGTTYNHIITADLTHNNQGNDTSSTGNIPDDIPVTFVTTLGTISTTGLTRSGKAELKLNSTTTGLADVTATLDNQTVSTSVNITSVNVLGIYNTRTQKGFTTIHDAVNDIDTRDGDTITLASGTYIDNVLITKRVTIRPVTGDNVTVKANDSDKSVFCITNMGSGSSIQGLNIIGSTDSYGISLSHAFNCNLSNNTISNCSGGIYLYISGNNTIKENTISSARYGVQLYKSNANKISGNIVQENEIGIYAVLSTNNLINGNKILLNWYGTYIYHSSTNNISSNRIENNWVGIYFFDTDNNIATGNNLTENGCGITYYDSLAINISGNNFKDNWLANTSIIDSGEMVMATTIYTCGPAALATVLKNMGIFTSEAELSQLAGTDQTGTSLYGLQQAAINKGLTATGVRITADQLQPDYIIVLNINDQNHYEIVKSINSTTVLLIDPNLGQIEMTRTQFDQLYTGIALIINDTIPTNATILTENEMKDIKAMQHKVLIYEKRIYLWPGGWYIHHFEKKTIKVPYIIWKWIPATKMWGWLPIPGHYMPYIGWKTATIWSPVWRYHTPVYYYYRLYTDARDEGEHFNWGKAFHVGIAVGTTTALGLGIASIEVASLGTATPVLAAGTCTGLVELEAFLTAAGAAEGTYTYLSGSNPEPTWIK